MRAKDIRSIAVIGAGTMGHGIAEVNLMAGFTVYLHDVSEEELNKGTASIYGSLERLMAKKIVDPELYSRIKNELFIPCLDFEKAVERADLVIEAVPEVMDLKKDIFKRLDRKAPAHAILATNTSTMSITEIASVSSRPSQVLGMHYFTPVVFMKLTEIIRGEKTSEGVMRSAFDFCLLTDRVPLRVEKDTPGFIANRVQQFPRAVFLGALLDEGIVEPEVVDAQWRRLGVPVAPYEMMDYAGLDVYLDASRYLAKALHPDYGASRKIEEMVKAGRLGRKTNKGFYDYARGKPQIDLNKDTDQISPLDLMAVIINEATKLLEEGLCSAEDIDKASIYGLGTERGPMTFAREMEPSELAERLERLAKRFQKEIFKPTKMIQDGTYR